MTCPQCGAQGFQGFIHFSCALPGCPNGPKCPYPEGSFHWAQAVFRAGFSVEYWNPTDKKWWRAPPTGWLLGGQPVRWRRVSK
jgi:hypothetical protein